MAKTISKKQLSAASIEPEEQAKRKYVSQSDVPSYSLSDALKVPEAIVNEYAGEPTRPLSVAKAMDLKPTSPSFRQRCGAAIAYGLTEGGYNAAEIIVTPLAKRILTPTVEGDDLPARREAFLRPRVLGLFLTKYDGSKIPRDDIAVNVLAEMNVPREAGESTLRLILGTAKELGLLTEIKGSYYVNLKGVKAPAKSDAKPAASEGNAEESDSDEQAELPDVPDSLLKPIANPVVSALANPARTDFRKKRVFITHGKEKSFLDPIKKLLGFGELEPVISTERQTVSQGVPDKVMADMRSCGAAIIHADAEAILKDENGEDYVVVNPNVLIEIGAAMALYGKRYILLVKKGVKLPSNLQGLYEVRYSGVVMDGDSTIRLLEAINDIKNHPLPE